MCFSFTLIWLGSAQEHSYHPKPVYIAMCFRSILYRIREKLESRSQTMSKSEKRSDPNRPTETDANKKRGNLLEVIYGDARTIRPIGSKNTTHITYIPGHPSAEALSWATGSGRMGWLFNPKRSTRVCSGSSLCPTSDLARAMQTSMIKYRDLPKIYP